MTDLSNLQYMAMIDPASVLVKQEPGELLVILVDALDELRYRHTEGSLLNWLASCPELPPNVRLVLTSRPDEDLLLPFREAQQPRLKEINLAAAEPDLLRDLQNYALALVEEPTVQVAMQVAGNNRDDFVGQAVKKAGGNIGYLDAIGRAIDQAVALKDQPALIRLLELSSLPDTLKGLCAFFLHQLKAVVGRESIAVVDPQDGKMHYLSRWSSVLCWLLGTSVREIHRFPRTDVPSSQHNHLNLVLCVLLRPIRGDALFSAVTSSALLGLAGMFHCDDDIALFVACVHIPVGFGSLF